jgi:Protein of unknown function (DUF3306)
MSESYSFLRRWSRLKLQAAVELSTLTPSIAPLLPGTGALDFSSDFSAFMHPRVDSKTRRNALHKLFMTDHFRAMDGLDVYVEDYTRPHELPAELLATLDHAQPILAPAEEKATEFLPERPEQT